LPATALFSAGFLRSKKSTLVKLHRFTPLKSEYQCGVVRLYAGPVLMQLFLKVAFEPATLRYQQWLAAFHSFSLESV